MASKLGADVVDGGMMGGLLVKGLERLAGAEKALLALLPELAKGAHTRELRETLAGSKREVKAQAARVDRMLKSLGQTRVPAESAGMSGILAECSEALAEFEKGNVRDAAVLASAARIEGYRVAAYGSLRDYAKLLGKEEVEKLVEETLGEIVLAGKRFGQIAVQVNAEAFMDSQSPECFLKHKGS